MIDYKGNKLPCFDTNDVNTNIDNNMGKPTESSNSKDNKEDYTDYILLMAILVKMVVTIIIKMSSTITKKPSRMLKTIKLSFSPLHKAERIRDYLWQDIQDYRNSFSLPNFKHNAELQSLMNKINPNTVDDLSDVLSASSVKKLHLICLR
ncbi:hypothetical protein [Lactobacillus apis]|uniref:hypothetical protein n=1 Tax=Lactobacillus apis TaxID=303541 RepID=UPI00242D1BA0|nr:hypothetical protein [Lactobacillus apis]